MGRAVVSGVDALLEGAHDRRPMHAADSKSGARFERVVIDGERYVVKYLSRDDDWIMRATGDLACRPVLVWELGLLDRVPACIDHTYAGVARTADGAAILMHDVSEWMIAEGDEPLPLEVHLGFLDHLAAFHAHDWASDAPVELMPLANRYTEFGPQVVACEAERGFPEPVPRIMGDGWARFFAGPDGPRSRTAVADLHADPSPLVAALESTPRAFCHGDWKMGNLGRRPDGRTILVDWANPGVGPPLQELTWYLALNRARLPVGHTKDDVIAAYRAALEARGVDTEPWWDRQLSLCLLGALVQFGWEKALGDPEELAWWDERAVAGARHLAP